MLERILEKIEAYYYRLMLGNMKEKETGVKMTLNELGRLQERKRYLSRISAKIKRRLAHAPEGTLRISDSSNKKRKQYYHRLEKTDRRGIYIKKNDRELVRKLAQKDYDKKLLAAMQKEMHAIDQYIKHMPEAMPEDIYLELNDTRKKLVKPEFETDQMFLEKWMDHEYAGKEFRSDAPILYTDKGERVRSKSEVIIANTLYKYKIPYRYEHPIILNGFGTVYPDFTLLDVKGRKEIYWEHQGMMDDPEYVEKAIRKLYYYMQNGIYLGETLIVTSETRSFPLNIREIEMIIEHRDLVWG